MGNDPAVHAPAAMPGDAAQVALSVSVCFAMPDRYWCVALRLEPEATVARALAASGLTEVLAGVDLARAAVGVFGKRVARTHRLADGDRVEIYRPLTFDPKDSRRRRAQHRQRLRKAESAHPAGAKPLA